ncbi:hypothetical protein [Roseivivax sp. THAF30]|uniref:hypothetical protein n=1 Tax=Roseivivax sp. THAF30 TaxID=2587852 RepID=UPI0012683DD7|nr:hypothetical protein [Roseivivax sp. THAF30]QFT61393.1 hypothetical protein FIU91_00520 [Roseivivax sp. THAF30]
MPNAIAYLMLGFWPIVTLAAFRLLPPGRALLVSVIGGYLLLPPEPAAFDLPLLPGLDKVTLPGVVCLACLVAFRNQSARSFWPESPLVGLLLTLYLATPLMTAVMNLDPVRWGRFEVPAMSLKDGVGLALRHALTILPFLLARQHLASGGALRDVALVVTLGGLAYVPLMLVEVPLGPILNEGFYGFQQALESQAERGDTYRPVVFLQHGLWVAFFTLSATLCAFTLWRSESSGRTKLLFAALLLLGTLLAMKSFGALLMALTVVPLLVLTGRRIQTGAAILIACLALAYPLSKTSGIVPEEKLLANIAEIDAERAYSLEFRMANENVLMERALERPFFGWGSWGRNHVMNSASGEWETITDGRWVLTLGVLGAVGLVAEFGLLLMPIFLLLSAGIARDPERFSPYAPPLALLLSLNIFDLIPNATLTPITWLLAGVLLAHAERPERRSTTDSPDATPRGPAPLRWKPIL